MESSSPSYGSLRESQLAGRFLDGPSSYRDSSGQIKWRSQHKVRFQSQQEVKPPQISLEDRLQELREQQQEEGSTPCSNEERTSTLSTILSSQALATSVTLHDQDSFLHNKEEAHLSTSLTGLELLQRGLSTMDLPDVSNMSSGSSSNVTYDAPNVTYDAPNVTYDAPNVTYDASLEPLQGEYYNLSPPLPDEEEDDIVFDLDME
jgi:hypothetical protein